jgi:hypothetical protein
MISKKIKKALIDLGNRIFGTKLQEFLWTYHRIHKNEPFPHSHRKLLIDILARYNAEKYFEIGCGDRINLNLLLKEKMGYIKVCGSDIKDGIPAEKQPFDDKTLDVVFTDATLIYIGPDKIKKVFKEMRRIAKKAIVIVEQHREGLGWRGKSIGGVWVRDYKKLMPSAIFTKIVNWGSPNWDKYGYIIEEKI